MLSKTNRVVNVAHCVDVQVEFGCCLCECLQDLCWHVARMFVP